MEGARGEGPLCTPVLTFTARAHARFQLLEFQHQLLVISLTLYDIAKQHACVLSGSGMENGTRVKRGQLAGVAEEGQSGCGSRGGAGGGAALGDGMEDGDGGVAWAQRGQKATGSPEEPGMALSTAAPHSPEDSLPPLAAVGEIHEALHGGGSWAPREVSGRSAPPRLTAEPSAHESVSGRAPPQRAVAMTTGTQRGGGGRCHR